MSYIFSPKWRVFTYPDLKGDLFMVIAVAASQSICKMRNT